MRSLILQVYFFLYLLSAVWCYGSDSVVRLFHGPSLSSIAMVVTGVVEMFVLIKREMTIENPSVPVLVFRHKRFTASFIVAAVMAMYSTCSATYGIVYVRTVLEGGTATLSGTVTMPQTIAAAVVVAVVFFRFTKEEIDAVKTKQ